MKISFLGAGRVAYHLAQTLQAQHQIVQVYSRNFSHAEKLAQVVNAQAIDQIANLNAQIDLLIIAVPDQAIAAVVQQLTAFSNVLLVHTSGSTPLTIFPENFQKTGVFYPLQTFSFERQIVWENTPLLLEAKHEADLSILHKLAKELTEKIYFYDSTQRLNLHLAAVFACNFSNYCYDMAYQIAQKQHIDFSLLFPLMTETLHKAQQYEPKIMQTGPAMRGDLNILNLHQQLLEQNQQNDLKKVYELLSEQILQRHQ